MKQWCTWYSTAPCASTTATLTSSLSRLLDCTISQSTASRAGCCCCSPAGCLQQHAQAELLLYVLGHRMHLQTSAKLSCFADLDGLHAVQAFTRTLMRLASFLQLTCTEMGDLLQTCKDWRRMNTLVTAKISESIDSAACLASRGMNQAL